MTQLRLLFLSASAFIVVFVIGGAFIKVGEGRRADEQRQALREIGTAQAHLLERQLDRSLSSTYALASILRQSGRIDNFDALAADIIMNYRGISNLQLAPNGVVRQIYPLRGNEVVIGHDLLNDPRRRTEALAAIESRQLTLAGPFTLIQGGVAVIGRLPVFVPDDLRGERFWGFTIALIRLPLLLEASKLNRIVENGYGYELSRIHPDTGERVVFARSAKSDLEDPLPFPIDVPNGTWRLSLAPRGGWRASSSLPAEVLLLVLISTLGACFAYALLRQPEILRREVRLRTRELAGTNQKLEAEIVERNRAEQQVRRYSEELEEMVNSRTERIQELERQRGESEKIAATGRMAARIAHEINNPLAGIKNSFLLIKDAVPEGHPDYTFVGRIENEIERITRIVRQMFELYRPDQKSSHEFSINEAIHDVVALLEPSRRVHDVAITVEMPEPPVIASLPEGSLRQVLFNIFQNAIEASPRGGLIKIATTFTEDSLSISVADYGSGIPDAVGSQVFEPFFTSKGHLPGGGLGLGLSVSKSLVEGMGGSLDFESRDGQGTVFRIVLPRHGQTKESEDG